MPTPTSQSQHSNKQAREHNILKATTLLFKRFNRNWRVVGLQESCNLRGVNWIENGQNAFGIVKA
jgi:hypothetical protein